MKRLGYALAVIAAIVAALVSVSDILNSLAR